MGFVTSRGPLTLAALASAAVPGLDPDTVEGVLPSGPGDPVEVAFVSDREHRRWVIRCPKTPAASAHLERSAALLALLTRRLTMPVPAVKGWVALPEGGRAAVHTYLTGRLVSFAGIEAGSTLAAGLGRTIAQLHNLDPRVYEEAGVPVYDAASYRSRRLAELDRAAATGRVPTGLLGRWEQVLDDESLWAFTATATHGAIGEDSVLATPDDGTGAEADVKTLLGWESAQVADPADDLAPLVAELPPEAVDTVLEAYAHARVERPDRHLRERARVIGEMQLVRSMMASVAAGDDAGAEEYATELRRLDDRLAREDEAAKAARPTSSEASSGSDSDTAQATATTAPSQPSKPSKADTQPVRTTSAAAATSDSAAPEGPASEPSTGSEPQAGAGEAESTEAESTGSESTDADTARTDSDSEAAVQVEHPATPTPVTQPESTTDDSSDATDAATGTSEAPAADADPEADATDSPATDEAAEDAPVGADAPETAEPGDDTPDAGEPEPAATGSADGGASPSQPKRGSDHVTAEVTPINDDDDDDVVPIRPR